MALSTSVNSCISSVSGLDFLVLSSEGMTLFGYRVISGNLCIFFRISSIICDFSKFFPHVYYYLFISVFTNLSWTFSCF